MKTILEKIGNITTFQNSGNSGEIEVYYNNDLVMIVNEKYYYAVMKAITNNICPYCGHTIEGSKCSMCEKDKIKY